MKERLFCNPCRFYKKPIREIKLPPSEQHDRLQKHLVKQISRKDIHKHGQSFDRTQLLYNGFTE